MIWPILAIIFLLSILFGLAFGTGVIFKLPVWQKHKSKIKVFTIIWFSAYLCFILFFTGPENLHLYPAQNISPYKLPWKSGDIRLVAQGNRSFTSHRGLHHYAWDFVMLNGTEVLAARAGRVVEVEDTYDWIGPHSNFVKIEHVDGQRSGYFHIRYKSSKVLVGDEVKQGQTIALSGMVGQTIFPHLHFAVFNREETQSLPITFSEVRRGVPLAGQFCLSKNGVE